MDFKGDSVPPEEYLVELIKIFNPYSSEITQKVIIFTSFNNTKISDTIHLLQNKNENKRLSSTMPTIPIKVSLRKDRNNSFTVVNTNSYLFASSQNECPCLSSINLMYFLTVYKEISIMIPVKESDSISKQIEELVKILKKLELILDLKVDQSFNFISCFSFVIGKADGNFDERNYLQELDKIKEESVSKNVYVILKSIIKEKRILCVSKIQNFQHFSDELTKFNGYMTNPKCLTQLYKKSFQNSYFQKLKKQLFEGNNCYYKKINALLILIKQAVQNRNIFSQNPQVRKATVSQQILEKSPLQNICKNVYFLTSKNEQKVDEFAIECAIFCLQNLYKTQNSFYDQNIKNNYENFNQNNQFAVNFEFDVQLSNKSLFGLILSNIFNENTIFYNSEISGFIKYQHIFFRIFENFPQANVRSHQISLIKSLQEIIMQDLIDFFVQNIDEIIQCITEDKSNQIEPRRLLSLTNCIERLYLLMNDIGQKQRDPYIKTFTISEKANIIKSTHLFTSWKCFETYKQIWSLKKKNQFMYDVLASCKRNEFMQYLNSLQKKQVLVILKKAHRYFGDMYLKQQKYLLAIEFYKRSHLNYKIIHSYNLWFQKSLEQKQFDLEEIEKGILKLANLGLVSLSLQWCCQFFGSIQENAFLLLIMNDLNENSNIVNKKIVREFQQFKFQKIQVVEQKFLNGLRNSLNFQDWRSCAQIFTF